ncbi:MAG: hypothetical protein J6U96_05415 [Elusimicrobiaceae bacterium]|nr:hypothetical protein [Elusimicrobiaceae bacterium]
MVKLILVTHGNLAEEMLKTATLILGKAAEGVQTLSVTTSTSIEQGTQQLTPLLADSPDGVIVLTDIFGGSATNIAITASKDFPKCHVITGLNLSMLLTALNSRKKLNDKELAEKIESDGKRAVINATELLIKGL